MPGMTGAKMLNHIRHIAPATIRIIFSSYVGNSDNLGAAHQHLRKPCTATEIINRVRSALSAQEALGNEALAQLIASFAAFPVLPSVYSDLVHDLDRDGVSLEHTAKLLQRDGSVFTRVMQVANSPLYGAENTITNPEQAILQLGTRNVKALVLSMHVFDGYDRIHFPEMPVELLWQHSCSVARFAQSLCAKSLDETAANNAFFAGLVHDLGCLVLMENHPSAFREACQKAQATGQPLHQVELETFRVAHEDISAFMLRLWGMPAPVAEAVLHHHAPWNAPTAERFSPTAALYAANILARLHSPHDRMPTPEIDQEYLERIQAPLVGPFARHLNGA
jgi:HD-like signal output (HDOD) protein